MFDLVPNGEDRIVGLASARLASVLTSIAVVRIEVGPTHDDGDLPARGASRRKRADPVASVAVRMGLRQFFPLSRGTGSG